MSRTQRRRTTLLGLGLDGAGLGSGSSDGQTRITRGDDLLLLGGSEALHTRLQEIAERVSQACQDAGTTLGEACPELVREILSDLPRRPR